MYDVFIVPYPKNIPKETYNLLSRSVMFTLQQVIKYVDTFKYIADQYELGFLDWSWRYMRNYLGPSLLDDIIKKTNLTSPGTVVMLAIFITVAYVSFNTMELCKR